MYRSWLIPPLLILYFLDLGGTGFLSKDEPRYASIGREMARSGDWITPKLDGAAWFEKPPLLYWMVAAGNLARLPDEWAARMPVAIVSVTFLLYFFYVLARIFEPKTAIAAVTILSTSAGWLAYSFGALTDLPMSAALGAAILVALFEKRKESGYIAGALLGLAILAKAFVPVVLFVPVFFLARGKRIAIVIGAIAVAAPWHILCSMRNGHIFWDEYFWRQQVGRFFTPERQHVQQFWFYLPILLAGLFPWTPLVAMFARGATLRFLYDDPRTRFTAAWFLYGLIFFSAAQNKLPGYLLPLMPALAVLLAFAIDKSPGAHWFITASVMMLVALPTIAEALPDAMLSGLGHTHPEFTPGLPFLLFAIVVWWLSWSGKPSLSILTAGMAVIFGVAYVKGSAFPALDERVSARGFWRLHHVEAAGACIDNITREWEYGLNYYAGRPFPQCGSGDSPRIVVQDGRLAIAK